MSESRLAAHRVRMHAWAKKRGMDLRRFDGIWYLTGEPPEVINHTVERCLHITRLDDMTLGILEAKYEELTRD